MEKNQSTFGKLKYGLHGKPLPNFFHKNASDAKLAMKTFTGEGDRAPDAQQ